MINFQDFTHQDASYRIEFEGEKLFWNPFVVNVQWIVLATWNQSDTFAYIHILLSQPGVTNVILENEPKSCLTVT